MYYIQGKNRIEKHFSFYDPLDAIAPRQVASVYVCLRKRKPKLYRNYYILPF